MTIKQQPALEKIEIVHKRKEKIRKEFYQVALEKFMSLFRTNREQIATTEDK